VSNNKETSSKREQITQQLLYEVQNSQSDTTQMLFTSEKQ